MGCQRLTYQTTEPLLKVVYRAEATDKKSVQRFLSIDPAAQFHSPYVGMGNNPVSMVDPDGAFAYFNHQCNCDWDTDYGPWYPGRMNTTAYLQKAFNEAVTRRNAIVGAFANEGIHINPNFKNITMATESHLEMNLQGHSLSNTLITTDANGNTIYSYLSSNSSDGRGGIANPFITLTEVYGGFEEIYSSSGSNQGAGSFERYESVIFGAGLGFGMINGAAELTQGDILGEARALGKKYGRVAQDTRQAYNTYSKISKFAKVGGVGLGVLSGATVAYDVVAKREIRASHLLNATVAGLSFVPVVGWAIGGTYFIGDMISEGVTGKSLGEHLNEEFGGGTLIKW